MPEELGEYLESARIAKGLSAEDIADISRVGIRFIHAAERGDFEFLPGAVFIKGLLRSYATILDMDGDELVGRYDALELTARDQSPELISIPLHEEFPLPASVIWSIIGGMTLVVVLVVYYFFGNPALISVRQPDVALHKTKEKQSLAQPVPVAKPVATKDTTSKPASLAAKAHDTGANEQAKRSDHLSDRSLPHKLTLIAESDAWIKVIADGETEREIILRAGKSVTWWAADSFRLSLGNVAGTIVRYNDTALEMEQPKSNILTNIIIPSPLPKRESPTHETEKVDNE